MAIKVVNVYVFVTNMIFNVEPQMTSQAPLKTFLDQYLFTGILIKRGVVSEGH